MNENNGTDVVHTHGRHRHRHGQEGWRLGLAAGLNSVFAIVQIVVGLAIGSVVVLADAAHQAVDAVGLIAAFIGLQIARRPPTVEWSYGFGKADALGGFVSALLLLASIVWISVESIGRLIEPEPVDGVGVIAIGLIAITVNAVGVVLVGHGHGEEAISLRAARLHLLADLAGSFVVVIAGVVLTATDAMWIDPIASLVLCAAVLWSTWRILRTATHVLLDRSPVGVSSARLSALLNEHPDVERVHHVHVSSMGAGRRNASAHVVVDGSTTVHRSQEIVDELAVAAEGELGLDHVTLQLECHPCAPADDCNDGAAAPVRRSTT